MKPPIWTPRRDIILDSTIRYGVSRNMPAQDEKGKDVLLALVCIERDNGAFETLAVREDEIRFHGEALIERRVKEYVGYA